MGRIEKTSGSISIIGGSDGPTSVFFAANRKKTIRQKVQKQVFAVRKKWYAYRLHPKAHTMEEVIAYLKEKYAFEEVEKDTMEYQNEYDRIRTSFILQYKPELLGAYAVYPQLKSHDEAGIREFQRQLECRERKARELSQEEFSIDLHVLKKADSESEMHFLIETVFGYIGGGFSCSKGTGKHRFNQIYKDVYGYYGVTEEDIEKETERYQELLTTLAMRN